jgi:hypothetical protein
MRKKKQKRKQIFTSAIYINTPENTPLPTGRTGEYGLMIFKRNKKGKSKKEKTPKKRSKGGKIKKIEC